MRVLLVGPDYEANLSLLYLASSLQSAGHWPVIAPFNTAADAPSVRRLAKSCDLVGLSMCFQVRALEFTDLAAALKQDEPARPIVAGGHFAPLAAAELLRDYPALDLVVVHEGEQTIVELANLGPELLARAGEVKGVVVREGEGSRSTDPRPILGAIDQLPRPDRSGPARLLCGVPTAYLMGSRGCVSACEYCCITTLHRMVPGPRFRQRPPEDVAAEMADLYHHHGVRQFVFHDDNFLVPNQRHNHARVDALRAALADGGVRDIGLVTKCSPRDADRAILEKLRSMGLLRLFMGIESGSDCGLKSIGRKQTLAQNERALALCEELGLSSQYTTIIFNPEATIASMLADLDFVDRHPGHPLNYCRAELYAGTPLEARMLAEGRAEGSYLGRTYRYSDPKVALVWELGSDLFAGRCWGKDEILGGVIRLDHQVAVLRHFYEGRKVQELARSFLAFEEELNLETSGFFRELIEACADATGASDPAIAALLCDLRYREQLSRAERLDQLCSFRKALERFSKASVSIGERFAQGKMAGRRFRGPRHAAAVAVAIGLLGCRTTPELGVMEAAPPPYGPHIGGPPIPPDAGVDAEPLRPPHRDDIGVAEAAPPPYDEPRPVPEPMPPDAGRIPPQQPPRYDRGVAEMAPAPRPAPDAGQPNRPSEGPLVVPNPDPRHDVGVAEAAPPPWNRPPVPPKPVRPVRPPDAGQPVAPKPPPVEDLGVAEAAPPPYDRYRHGHGVAEAAPPPYDRYRNDDGVAEAAPPPYDPLGNGDLVPPPPSTNEVTVFTSPRVTLSYARKEVTQPFKLLVSRRLPLTVGKPGDAIEAVLVPTGVGDGALRMQVNAVKPLLVSLDGRLAEAESNLKLKLGVRHQITLEDPATHARVVVTLMPTR